MRWLLYIVGWRTMAIRHLHPGSFDSVCKHYVLHWLKLEKSMRMYLRLFVVIKITLSITRMFCFEFRNFDLIYPTSSKCRLPAKLKVKRQCRQTQNLPK